MLIKNRYERFKIKIQKFKIALHNNSKLRCTTIQKSKFKNSKLRQSRNNSKFKIQNSKLKIAAKPQQFKIQKSKFKIRIMGNPKAFLTIPRKEAGIDQYMTASTTLAKWSRL